ncbi:hypothetical protein [Nitrosomonas supralitoralis]|nr:hypothetical protein [Nitrosomonas supralitoralis]
MLLKQSGKYVFLWMQCCNRLIEARLHHWNGCVDITKKNLMDQRINLFVLSWVPCLRTKESLLTKITGWLIKLCVCCAGIRCLVFQTHATSLSSANTNTPFAVPAPATTTTVVTRVGSGVNKSKLPPITVASRRGLFSLPFLSPGYYSFWDMVTSNKREKPPVVPYAPFALMTTPAYDTDSRLNAADSDNSFHLQCTRFHADLWYKDRVRLFV